MPSKELIVSQSQHETKVGILEDGQLVEVFFQRANEYSLAGSIHKGRVTRVLPGMQSAFVDLGLERDTFLYVSDFFEEHGDDVERIEDQPSHTPKRGRGRDRERERDQERPPEVPPAATSDNGATPVAEAAAPAQQDEQKDRRGRRSRRRRRGGKGFPDSKYASAEQTAEAGVEPEEGEAEVAGESPAIEIENDTSPVSAEAEEPFSAAVPAAQVDEFLVLPGESLAKYRRSATARMKPSEPAAEVRDSQPAAESVDSAAAEDVIEQLLDRVDEIDQAELEASLSAGDEQEKTASEAADEDGAEPVTAAAELGSEAVVADSNGDATLAAAATEVASPDESEPAVAESETKAADASADVLSEQDREVSAEVSLTEVVSVESESPEPAVAADNTATELSGDAEPLTNEAGETIAQAVEDDGSVELARTPQSLTATLRAQGGRAHRVSRRMRRRGRGAQQQDAEAEPAEARAEVPVEPVEAPPAIPEPKPEKQDRPERERPERPPLPSISDLLKEGQEIIVQIAKEPLGQKGARITSHIALPGRYVVYMPTVDHFGVSRKISTDEERQRLKKILQKHKEGVPGGYIMRTAGEGRTEEEIAADMNFLATLWQDIKNKADKRRAPTLLHHDVEIVERIMRDQLTDGFKAVWVDNEELYEQVLHSTERLAPALLSRIKLYTRPEPIFDAFGITQELEKALRPKVWLKSGGYIVINQTEALVAIDVNTGKYVGKSNRLEDTIVKTNTEAVKEIVRQMRLRDLGGIIVVDFIDMDERKNRQKVMQTLEEAMKADKAPYKILQFNDFGLVAITRKRVKQSLERTLCAPCPHCEGAGYVKSVQTIIGEILTQAQKYSKVVDGKECLLRVNPEVAKVLKSVENKYLEELEEVLGRPVLVTADALLHQEKFDLT